jgi:hypothetical protein
MKIGSILGVIVVAIVGGCVASNFVEAQKAKPELQRKHTHEIDAAQGLMAANVCKDWTPDSHRQIAWCADFMSFVPGSDKFDQATVTRWRDTFFASYCGSYVRNPKKHADITWCDGYLKLLPEAKAYAGNEYVDRWLFEDRRYRYVCFDLPKNAEMTKACKGYSYRPGLHSWRVAEAEPENAS